MNCTRLRAMISTLFIFLGACTWEPGKAVSVLSAPTEASRGALAPNGTYRSLGLICLDETGKKTSSYLFNETSASEQIKLTDGLYETRNESSLCSVTFSGAYQILSSEAGNALFFQTSVAVSKNNPCSVNFQFNREDPNFPDIPATSFRQTYTSSNSSVTHSLKMIYDPTFRVLYLSTTFSNPSSERCFIASQKKE